MNPIEGQHDREHQASVEDIQKDLVAQYVSLPSLQVLNNTEDASHKDQQAANVEGDDVLLPLYCLRSLRWCFAHANVEHETDDHKGPEEDELDEETTNDDVLASLDSRSGARRQETAALRYVSTRVVYKFAIIELTRTLHEKRKDVTANKDLRHPCPPHKKMLITVHHLDDTSEFHIY